MKFIHSIAVCITMLCSMAFACSPEEDFGGKNEVVEIKPVAVTGVTINKETLTIAPGASATLSASISPSNAANKKVTWSSSDESIASVDNGLVTGIKDGSATITVKTDDGGKTATCKVTVSTVVTGVSLNKESLSLSPGASETLTASITPSDASNQKITWSSSDESIATVAEGKVTAVKNGSATITVKTDDGGKTATCSVTVSTSVTGITLNKSSITLAPNSSETLIAEVSPAGASIKSIVWRSSDETVATVTDGKVTAKNNGNATITVMTEDGKVSATCAVTVATPVTYLKLNAKSIKLAPNEEYTLTVSVTPENASTDNLVWTSSDAKIASVDNGIIKALGVGDATITVTSEDGNIRATCSVSVVIPVSNLTLNQKTLTVYVGKTDTLKAIITPDNATKNGVSWYSENTTIAKVSKGVVKGISLGTVTIKATSDDNAKIYDKCTVTVKNYIAVSGIGLTYNKSRINKGEKLNISAVVRPTNAINKNVIWSSSDTSVATVDGGVVTAVGGGRVKITATTEEGNYTASCELEVTVPLQSVSLNKSETSLLIGDTETLSVAFNPIDASDKKVTWTSSNTSVATVKDGIVTAVAVGTSTITALSNDNRHSASCTVTVKGPTPVSGISLSPSSITTNVGKSGSFVATVTPADAINKKVQWSSSDDSVVTVLSDGSFTAIGLGSATITATTEDGGFTASCTVNVIIPVSGIKISPVGISAPVGRTGSITATVSPEDAGNKKVLWSSSNTSVVTVSSDGSYTAVGTGKATITATTEDGGFTASCSIQVTLPATGISINKTSLDLDLGSSETLIPTVTPSNTTEKTVIWSSSNTSVATVTNGTVKAVGEGNAVIEAKTANGRYKATCNVTVRRFVTGVTLNMSTTTLKLGQKGTLVATVNPSNATIKDIIWTSSDDTVVSCSSYGNITGKKVGTATITATAKDGGKTATCLVTVINIDSGTGIENYNKTEFGW